MSQLLSTLSEMEFKVLASFDSELAHNLKAEPYSAESSKRTKHEKEKEKKFYKINETFLP